MTKTDYSALTQGVKAHRVALDLIGKRIMTSGESFEKRGQLDGMAKGFQLTPENIEELREIERKKLAELGGQ